MIPLKGYLTFTAARRRQDVTAWEDEPYGWAEQVLLATLDAAEVEKWKADARTELELAVPEPRMQLDAMAGALRRESSTCAPCYDPLPAVP